jgi:hypothetical protein
MKFPLCPHCEGPPISVVQSREGTSYFDPETSELVHQTIYTLECDRGHRFAHSRRWSEVQEWLKVHAHVV